MFIHTVGPVYGQDDVNLLADCYKNSLKLAEEYNCRSIAFPAISTGVYMVPIELSAKIVKDVVKDFKSDTIKEIWLVMHGQDHYRVYLEEFSDLQ